MPYYVGVVGAATEQQEREMPEMVAYVNNLSAMADVAESKNMTLIAANIRRIIGEANRRGVNRVRITKLSALQLDTLNNLWKDGYLLMEEMGQATAEAERASEAYRLGLL
jgi:hypothetical protein